MYGLSSETAATYLADGASGICFFRARAPLYEVAYRLPASLSAFAHDDYGVWLLWADALDQTHHRLRAQLGLSAVSTPTEPVLERQQGRGAVAADAVDYSAAVAADPKPALQVAQFAIVVMSAGRIVDKFVMSAPFSFDAVHAFASAFARGRLQRNSRLRAAASMMAKVITACLAAVVGTFGLRIRRRRESSASANAAISGSNCPDLSRRCGGHQLSVGVPLARRLASPTCSSCVNLHRWLNQHRGLLECLDYSPRCLVHEKHGELTTTALPIGRNADGAGVDLALSLSTGPSVSACSWPSTTSVSAIQLYGRTPVMRHAHSMILRQPPYGFKPPQLRSGRHYMSLQLY